MTIVEKYDHSIGDTRCVEKSKFVFFTLLVVEGNKSPFMCLRNDVIDVHRSRLQRFQSFSKKPVNQENFMFAQRTKFHGNVVVGELLCLSYFGVPLSCELRIIHINKSPDCLPQTPCFLPKPPCSPKFLPQEKSGQDPSHGNDHIDETDLSLPTSTCE